MRRLLLVLFWAGAVASVYQACVTTGRERMMPLKPGAYRAD